MGLVNNEISFFLFIISIQYIGLTDTLVSGIQL